MKLTRARIEEIALKLRGMPPAPPAEVPSTKQDAMKLLANEIASLQRRGYTLEQITESLRGEGLELTTPTLKSYLSRAKAGRRRRRTAPAAGPLPAPSTRDVTGSLTKKDMPTKSGKDAFLVKDKASY